MYAAHAIPLRDPFACNNVGRYGSPDSWPPCHSNFDLNRALTPPPEMNGGPCTSEPAYHQQEREHYGNGHMPPHQAYNVNGVLHSSADHSSHSFRTNGFWTQSNSQPVSPIRQHLLDPQQPSHQRRPSQANAIAPLFQIPSTVNSSGGSLSELAAQITCLFWFESSDLLSQIEKSTIPIHPSRQLVPDTKPSTGFRKWVTTILSTTLVAQNVVLLALLFIYRLKKLNPSVKGKPGSEYRLLTVALMLGNKFLDDNTYTNKTWAEVSGIAVTEVHIMEVEFLSNMKYCLFTSAEDWAEWQSLLGKFAAFFEQAIRQQQGNQSARHLPPASSLYVPAPLPSPPTSSQASPPYSADLGPAGSIYQSQGYPSFTPAPSPLAVMSSTDDRNAQSSRKRSHDDYLTEPPAKRLATTGFKQYDPLSRPTAAPTRRGDAQWTPRVPLPDLAASNPKTSSAYHSHSTSQFQQLPPLDVPSRTLGMVYPIANNQVQIPQISSLIDSSSHSPSQRLSPFACPSAAVSAPAASSLRAGSNVSPNYYLGQRTSPYKPIHHVSTLTHPPPSSALQYRPQSIEYDQMRYQPLGKPIEQRRTGRLPYVAQNVWVDGDHQQAMTPVDQWPSFAQMQYQRHFASR